MSKLRSINTSIWSDPWIEDLEPHEKLLFIYLITNEKTNMLGIYEATIKKISFETGIDKVKVDKALKGFERVGKVKYTDNYIILINFLKHQNFNTNMKKSAIHTYNNLPKHLRSSKLDINKDNPSEGFESLLNHFGMVRKVEVEVEVEEEVETKEELELEVKTKNILMSKADALDVTEKNRPYFKIASSFHKLFEYNSTEQLNVQWKHLRCSKAESSCNDIRIAIEQDKRTEEDFRLVWAFLKKDDFWMKNIQSTKNLREKFDQLITKAKNQNNGKEKQSFTDTANGFFASNDPDYKNY